MNNKDTIEDDISSTLATVIGKIVESDSDTTGDGLRPDRPRAVCVLYHNVQYLGSATVSSTSSKQASQLQSFIEMLTDAAGPNHQAEDGPEHPFFFVTLSVERADGDGLLRVLDETHQELMFEIPVESIEHCICGCTSDTAHCVIFAVAKDGVREEHKESTLYGFRLHSHEVANKVIGCFDRELPNVEVSGDRGVAGHKFRLEIDIKESDLKNRLFQSVSRKRNILILNKNSRKQLGISIERRSDTSIRITRCFGILLAAGTNVPNRDMSLLDTVGASCDEKTGLWRFTAVWEPELIEIRDLEDIQKEFDMIPMTLALDLVLSNIEEPIRLRFEFGVRLGSKISQLSIGSERFSFPSLKRLLHSDFILISERLNLASDDQRGLIVRGSALHHVKPRDNSLVFVAFNERSDGQVNFNDVDDVVLSGDIGGEVEQFDAGHMESWSHALSQWTDGDVPTNLVTLVDQDGVPNDLRGNFWFRVASQTVKQPDDVLRKYRECIDAESPFDAAIERDLARTFPAHKSFQDVDGTAQKSLFRICKGYALHDPKVAYCQGISFIVATLLVHLPEEHAYIVLLKIMDDQLARELFLPNFYRLHCCCFQLYSLMKDHVPSLHKHFASIKLEVHMFALQWFLTLFTSKFQLPFVSRVLDLFLIHGFQTLFKIAIAILKYCQEELHFLDLEGSLRFFRVSIPRIFARPPDLSRLMKLVRSVDIEEAELNAFEKDFINYKNSKGGSTEIIQQEQFMQAFAIDSLTDSLYATQQLLDLERSTNDTLRNRLATLGKQLRSLLEANQQQVKLIELYKQLYYNLKSREDTFLEADDILKEMDANNLEVHIFAATSQIDFEGISELSAAPQSTYGGRFKKLVDSVKKNIERALV